MCDACEAALDNAKRQMYRMRVCLVMERAGKPTANLSIRALQYIADSFRVGMLPIDCAKYLQSFEEVWKTNAGASDACNRSVQPA